MTISNSFSLPFWHIDLPEGKICKCQVVGLPICSTSMLSAKEEVLQFIKLDGRLQAASVLCLSTLCFYRKADLTFYFCQAFKQNLLSLPNENEENEKFTNSPYSIECPPQPARWTNQYHNDTLEQLNNKALNLSYSNNKNDLNIIMKRNISVNIIKKIMKKNLLPYTVHCIANAESYAIDLFWDIMARFSSNMFPLLYNEEESKFLLNIKEINPIIYEKFLLLKESSTKFPSEFYSNMMYIVEQEAEHFYKWELQLMRWGYPLGIFPSQDGLWQSASETCDSVLNRLSVVNLTHEAKGLDSSIKLREKIINLICTSIKNYYDKINLVNKKKYNNNNNKINYNLDEEINLLLRKQLYSSCLASYNNISNDFINEFYLLNQSNDFNHSVNIEKLPPILTSFHSSHSSLFNINKDKLSSDDDIKQYLSLSKYLIGEEGEEYLDSENVDLDLIEIEIIKSCLDTLENNYREEIGHVKYGIKWFNIIVKELKIASDSSSTIELFHLISSIFYKGKLKPPFNERARLIADMNEDWYLPIAQLD